MYHLRIFCSIHIKLRTVIYNIPAFVLNMEILYDTHIIHEDLNLKFQILFARVHVMEKALSLYYVKQHVSPQTIVTRSVRTLE